MWRNTAVAVSVVSVKLGPRSCRRVLGAESIVATNLDHPNVVATYVYDSVEQPPDVNNDGASSSGFKGNSGSRAFAIQVRLFLGQFSGILFLRRHFHAVLGSPIDQHETTWNTLRLHIVLASRLLSWRIFVIHNAS